MTGMRQHVQQCSDLVTLVHTEQTFSRSQEPYIVSRSKNLGMGDHTAMASNMNIRIPFCVEMRDVYSAACYIGCSIMLLAGH